MQRHSTSKPTTKSIKKERAEDNEDLAAQRVLDLIIKRSTRASKTESGLSLAIKAFKSGHHDYREPTTSLFSLTSWIHWFSRGRVQEGYQLINELEKLKDGEAEPFVDKLVSTFVEKEENSDEVKVKGTWYPGSMNPKIIARLVALVPEYSGNNLLSAERAANVGRLLAEKIFVWKKTLQAVRMRQQELTETRPVAQPITSSIVLDGQKALLAAMREGQNKKNKKKEPIAIEGRSTEQNAECAEMVSSMMFSRTNGELPPIVAASMKRHDPNASFMQQSVVVEAKPKPKAKAKEQIKIEGRMKEQNAGCADMLRKLLAKQQNGDKPAVVTASIEKLDNFNNAKKQVISMDSDAKQAMKAKLETFLLKRNEGQPQLPHANADLTKQQPVAEGAAVSAVSLFAHPQSNEVRAEIGEELSAQGSSVTPSKMKVD